MLLRSLGMFAYCSSFVIGLGVLAAGDKCDTLPSEQVMMKSLRPASIMVMGCTAQLNEFPIRASALHDVRTLTFQF
ncbi:hypothetical protein BIW11_13625 [Tropilaelaps mercedesae]|uniref:Secreted protein n=1 Tax=Tropilaelaps mercedesae TaxID=418985 RepID=A0A1V9X184_9ACAR|nr:hypothetical protein BIW11_13625 [Tropilaelaps mercedesae]